MASDSSPAEPVIEIVPLTAYRWTDVTDLFDEGGDPRTCSCMYWRLPSRDWTLTDPEKNRTAFRALIDEDPHPEPGLVAYRDGRAIGWVSVGPREQYERLAASRVRPRIDDLPVWSIVCFIVSRNARRRGLTARLLDAAVDHARDHGAPAVDAYPVDAEGGRIPAAVGYTGLLSTFIAAGFHVVRDVASPRSTVRRVIVRRRV